MLKTWLIFGMIIVLNTASARPHRPRENPSEQNVQSPIIHRDVTMVASVII